jgi:hypothetical protein
MSEPRLSWPWRTQPPHKKRSAIFAFGYSFLLNRDLSRFYMEVRKTAPEFFSDVIFS